MSIQSIGAGSVSPSPEIEKARLAQPSPADEQAVQPRRIEPAFDEYIPEEKCGKMPRMASKARQTTINTDKVDRELEQLRKKLEELQSRLSTAAPEQRQALARQAAQVEQELAEKDNDAYRKQNAVVS